MQGKKVEMRRGVRKADDRPLTPHFLLLTVVQAVKLLPHPQPPVAFGLLKVKPEPCIELT